MNLREALKAIESYDVISWNDTLRLITEAAKRELEREEKKVPRSSWWREFEMEEKAGPKKVPLQEIEEVLRRWDQQPKELHFPYYYAGQAAEIIRALRDVVIPELRRDDSMFSNNLLRVLGEEP